MEPDVRLLVGDSMGEMLAYYAQHFPVVEINSSYYGVPSVRTVENHVAAVLDKLGVRTRREVRQWVAVTDCGPPGRP